jgi:hypothetical protein
LIFINYYYFHFFLLLAILNSPHNAKSDIDLMVHLDVEAGLEMGRRGVQFHQKKALAISSYSFYDYRLAFQTASVFKQLTYFWEQLTAHKKCWTDCRLVRVFFSFLFFSYLSFFAT